MTLRCVKGDLALITYGKNSGVFVQVVHGPIRCSPDNPVSFEYEGRLVMTAASRSGWHWIVTSRTPLLRTDGTRMCVGLSLDSWLLPIRPGKPDEEALYDAPQSLDSAPVFRG